MRPILDKWDGGCALYIDGNLQFDSRDERIYHESLALPALCLARDVRSVLICGGGDGLALREVLRFPGVEKVDLVDLSEEVVSIGLGEIAGLNGRAFEDPRVRVHLQDALEFPIGEESYDVVICDFTFPESDADSMLFTQEWFERLGGALRPGGVLVTNAVSPQTTPSGFACIVRTIRAAGLATLPFRVCVPSFRAEGYGAWGFVLASASKITIDRLRAIRCPVPTVQTDVGRLWRGARFGMAERKAFRTAPVHRRDNPVLIRELAPPDPATPPSLEGLLGAAVPHHSYHTRQMIEELARQVCGSISTIDLRRLVNELWSRVAQLPEKLRQELAKLRDFINDRFFRAQDWSVWSSRIFTALVLVMTLANSLAPDNAFGKGAHGLGHSSFSRGFEGMGSMHGSFRSAGPHVNSVSVTGRGFRSGYGNQPVDIYGQPYVSRVFYYYDDPYYGGYGYGGPYGYGGTPYGGGGGGSAASRQPQGNGQASPHKPLFVADDDLFVLDNGDAVITLSPDVFLRVNQGTIRLMSHDSGEPIAAIYPEPALINGIHQDLADQEQTVRFEIENRKSWLSWVGWTSSMFKSIQDDQHELENLQSLDRKLLTADEAVGLPPKNATPLQVPPGAVELFVGCYITGEAGSLGSIVLFGPDGKPQTLDPSALGASNPRLAKAISSVLAKMIPELRGDLAQIDHDLTQNAHDTGATQNDYNQYNSIYQSYWDGSYEVDYGTQSIPVRDAISRTAQDLNDLQAEQTQLLRDETTKTVELERMQALLQRLPAG